jgi:cholesterol transport system auxiliary component
MTLFKTRSIFLKAAARRAGVQPLALALAFSGVLAAALLGGCALPDKPRRAALYDFGPGALVNVSVAPGAPVAHATPATPATAGAPRPVLPPLAIDDISSAGGALDGQALLYRLAYADGQQLRPYAQARWSMPPAQLLGQRLRERLGQQRAVVNAREGVALNRSQNASLPLLRLQLQEFSQLFSAPGASAGLIRLQATLLEMTPAGEKLIAQRTVTLQHPAPSADAAGGVRALTAASDAAIEELAQWLAQAEAR